MNKYIKFNLRNFKKIFTGYLLLISLLVGLGLSMPSEFNDNIALPDSIEKAVNTGNSQGSESYLISLKESSSLNSLVSEYSMIKVPDKNFIKYKTPISERSTLVAIGNKIEENNKCSTCEKIGVYGAISKIESKPKENTSEIIGVLFALVILYLAFGSIVSAVLPVLIALLSLLMAFMLLSPISHIVSIPSFAPMMMSLLAIGVGIDYTLFILSRFKHEFETNSDKELAIQKAFSTSGKATILAGVTVIVSLLGIMLSGVKFLNGLAIASTLGVLFTLLNTFVLLPKLLHVFSNKIVTAKDKVNDKHDLEGSSNNRFMVLGQSISRRPVVYLSVGLVIIAILVAFSPSLRMGPFDASLATKNTGSKVYADLYEAKGLTNAVDPYYASILKSQAESFESDISGFTILNKFEDESKVNYVIGSIGESHTKKSYEGYKKLNNIALKYDSKVMGTNMVYALLSDYILGKLKLFVLIISLISFLILLILFRSLPLALISTVSNILISLASFGALAIAFEYGLFTKFIGLGSSVPINPFLPILFLAILFGLAMDYQVFLLSRLNEEYKTLPDPKVAMIKSLEHTGRVITNAALIMVVVFTSFAFVPDINIRMAGLGLSTSIFLDAFIMRIFIIPSLVFVLKNKVWYLPKFLKKIIPEIKLD